MGFIALLIISVISVLSLIALGLGVAALVKLNRESNFVKLIDAEQRKTPPSTLAIAWDNVHKVFTRNGHGPDWDSSVTVTTIQDVLLSNDTEIEIPSIRRWLHWPRYLAGMFVFIGLLGTVWGMAAAVSGLGNTVALTSNVSGTASSSAHSSSSFTIDQWSKLLSGIDSLLTGMNIAFRCTLFGLFATVLVSALNSFYVSRCEIFEANLQRLVSTIFLPLKQRTDKAGLVSEQVERLGTVVDKFDKTAVSLSSSLHPAAAKLLTVAEKAETLTGQLNQATHQSREEAQLISQRYVELRNTIQESYSHLEKIVEKSYSQVQDALAAVAALPLESYADLKQSADSLSSAAIELAAERVSFAETTKTVNIAAAKMEAAVSKLTVDLANSQDASAARLETSVDQIATTLETARNENNALQTALVKQFEGTHRSFAVELAAERLAFADTTKTVNASAARMETAVGQLTINLSDAQKESNAHQTALVKQFEGTHQSLDKLVRRFELSLNDISAANSSTPLRDELRQIMAELAHLRQNIAAFPIMDPRQSQPQELPAATPINSEQISHPLEQPVYQNLLPQNGSTPPSIEQANRAGSTSRLIFADVTNPNSVSFENHAEVIGQGHSLLELQAEEERKIGFVNREERKNSQSENVNRDAAILNVGTENAVTPSDNMESMPSKEASIRATDSEGLIEVPVSADSPIEANSSTLTSLPPPSLPDRDGNSAKSIGAWQRIRNFFKRFFRLGAK